MRKLLATATIAGALVAAGCTSQTTPQEEPKSTAVVIVDPQTECQPKGVPGNCWLPLFSVPVLGSTPLNSTPKCNNTSRDQSSCWPQPGTELQAECVRNGADGRPWYGFEVPRKHITDKRLLTETPEDKSIYGYAAAVHLKVIFGDVGDLDHCGR